LGRLLGRYAWAHGGDMHRALNMVIENVPLVRAGTRAPGAVRRVQPDRKPSPRLARRSPARGAPRAQRLSSDAPVERQVAANPPAPRKRPAVGPQPQPQRRVTAPTAAALNAHAGARSPFVVGHSTPTPAMFDDPRAAPAPDPSAAAQAAARLQKPVARPTPRPVQPRDVRGQTPSPATGRAPQRRQPAVERPETRQPPRHPLPPPGRSFPPKKPPQR
jgi:hypothetical protein